MQNLSAKCCCQAFSTCCPFASIEFGKILSFSQFAQTASFVVSGVKSKSSRQTLPESFKVSPVTMHLAAVFVSVTVGTIKDKLASRLSRFKMYGEVTYAKVP